MRNNIASEYGELFTITLKADATTKTAFDSATLNGTALDQVIGTYIKTKTNFEFATPSTNEMAEGRIAQVEYDGADYWATCEIWSVLTVNHATANFKFTPKAIIRAVFDGTLETGDLVTNDPVDTKKLIQSNTYGYGKVLQVDGSNKVCYVIV